MTAKRASSSQRDDDRRTVPTAQQRVLRRLRNLLPQRDEPISWLEAEHLAAHQAMLLNRLAGGLDMDAADFITSLPTIRLELHDDLPIPHVSYWHPVSQRWIIALKLGLSSTDQRTAILHEFKRILDYGRTGSLYDARRPHGYVQAEMAADYFTGCALMPGREVRVALRVDTSPTYVADTFHVSEELAIRRLSELGALTHHLPNLERREP